MGDLISRLAAIESIRECAEAAHSMHDWDMEQGYLNAIECIEEEPSAQPEVKEIGYAECANAMLKMWIDNVLTDGEYNRIMDKLNTHHNAGRRRAESEDRRMSDTISRHAAIDALKGGGAYDLI